MTKEREMKLVFFAAVLLLNAARVITQETCSNGKVNEFCGTACPLTCDNYMSPPLFCTAQCVQGCFCPAGMVELSEGCVLPDDCPTGATTEAPTESPCATFTCPTGSSCEVYTPTGQAYCVPSCSLDNGGCATDQLCTLVEVQCFTAPCPQIVDCMSCADGRVYQECGSACATTCDNYMSPPLCLDACRPGCFCPEGTVLHVEDDRCVATSDCPGTEVCSDDKVYQECGPLCPESCETFYGVNPCFSLRCSSGCFCPGGLLEHEGGCLEATECPNACTNGKVFEQCGTACPLTCDNYQTAPVPCTLQCVQDCFCPQGLVQSGDSCVQPSDCPVTDPCAVVDCQQYHYCEVSSVTGNAVCVPSCELENGGCRSDQICTIEEYDCFSTNGDPCDPNQYIQCKNSPYVPCSSASESTDCPAHSRCLTQSTTGQSICLQSCYRDNGGCAAGDVCITELLVDDCQYGEECETDVTCRSLNALERDCPAGKERTECGTACPETCETYVAQEIRPCIELCVGGCFCPQGLVVYRDRCVDPKECYSLLQDPPALNPLPIDRNSVLLELRVSDLSFEDFSSATQDLLTQSVERLLEREGYSTVTVTIHTAYEDQQLLVILMITGGNVAYSKADEIASLILDNQEDTPLSLRQVSAVDAPLLAPSLSTGAIAGIAVAAVLVVVILGVGVAVGVARCTNKRKGPTMQENPAYGEIGAKQSASVNTYSNLEELDVEKPPLGSE